MSTLNIDGITTMADLKAQARQPSPEANLDRNAFLRLFTTQLQNQNPLDPMKNEAFVAQLAQFSSLEATTRMSDSLDQFVTSQSTEKVMRGAALIGKNVFVSGATVEQSGGKAIDGMLNLEEMADSVVLQVVNPANGQIVNQMDLGPQMAGEVEFAWNGGTFAGEAAPAGEYVFLAEMTRGETAKQIPVLAEARVRGVSWSDEAGQVLLEIADGQSVPLSEIKRILD
jgi:flagellar basal-body rod modification protein FlgD